jgi:capsular exopolysaccharide synthesis family protein
MADSFTPQRWTGPNISQDPGGVRVSGGAEQEARPLKPLLELLALVRRHIGLVVFTAAVSTGVTIYRVHRQPPAYRATAVIRLADKGRELSGGLGGSAAERFGPATADPLLTQVQVLRSRAVARDVVAREGLRLRTLTRGLPPGWIAGVHVADSASGVRLRLQFSADGALVGSGTAAVRVAYGAPVAVRGVRFTLTRNPGVESAELGVVPLDTAIGDVLGGLSGRPRERTDIIDVSYVATDPVKAQRVVNSAVEAFQALSANTLRQRSVRRRQFIEQQLRKTDSLLTEAQLAYNAFRSREKVYSSQEKLKTQQSDLTGLEVRRQELEADRRMYASLLNAIQSSRRSASSGERLSALVSSPGIAQNPVVAQLYAQLVQYQAARDSLTSGTWASSPNSPDVKRLDVLIASTESKVISAVRGQISSVEARVAALDELKTRAAGAISSLPQTESAETRLLARVEAHRRAADRLREELQKAQIEEAAEAGQIEIIDFASLPGAIGTGGRTKVALALLLGLMLGAALAYVQENRSTVVRRREELEHGLQVPILALIPRIGSDNGNGRRLLPMLPTHRNAHANGQTVGTELVTVSDRGSTSAEAYRTLRTNLLFSAAVQTLKRIVVTSAGPQEGKSTTAANLAVALAQQGHRVLLVDCDLRRPRVHKIFQQPQQPGLTGVLVGNVIAAAAIRPTEIDQLSILPSGALPPNPTELLGSPQMKATLDRLAENFEMVVLDTPPVLAASDAAILGGGADGVLVVVRAGQTEWGAVQATVQQLSNVGARILGTVLNDPDAEVAKYAAHYGYYSYDKYHPQSESKA